MAKILIIEDNIGNLELMSYLLGAFGHEPISANTGEKGIDAARSESPDLIVCDIHLPEADGYAVARALKSDASLKPVPLIAVTAMAMVGDADKGLAAGFDGYISKPIDPHNFVNQIEAWLPAEQRGKVPVPCDTPDATVAQADSSAASQAGHRASILVVDDSSENRELIRDTLAPCGYEVRLAHSVEAALRMVRDYRPDLILSDLHMPCNDGFELLRQIKADGTLADVPFVFISSSAWGEQDREEADRHGITRFMLRPIEPRMLQIHVAACLENIPGVREWQKF